MRDLQRWRGVILILPVLVATVIMAVTGQLVLYIHPRYVVFTIALTAVALVLLIGAVVTRRHLHDDGLDELPASRRSNLLAVTAFVVAGAVAVLMLALPPATLSSETAAQRDLVGSTAADDAARLADAADAPVASFASFTVLEWSALLRQTQDPVFFAEKPVDVVGFVAPDPAGSADVFYVARFKITCCAVDAAPTAIPVYYPGWQNQLAADEWVQVTGFIEVNPSAGSDAALAVAPAAVVKVNQPGDPYLY